MSVRMSSRALCLSTLRSPAERDGGRVILSPSLACLREAGASLRRRQVILSPSRVIPSEARNLLVRLGTGSAKDPSISLPSTSLREAEQRRSLRVNFAKNLCIFRIKHCRDSSSPEFTLSATKGFLGMTHWQAFSPAC